MIWVIEVWCNISRKSFPAQCHFKSNRGSFQTKNALYPIQVCICNNKRLGCFHKEKFDWDFALGAWKCASSSQNAILATYISNFSNSMPISLRSRFHLKSKMHFQLLKRINKIQGSRNIPILKTFPLQIHKHFKSLP